MFLVTIHTDFPVSLGTDPLLDIDNDTIGHSKGSHTSQEQDELHRIPVKLHVKRFRKQYGSHKFSFGSSEAYKSKKCSSGKKKIKL